MREGDRAGSFPLRITHHVSQDPSRRGGERVWRPRGPERRLPMVTGVDHVAIAARDPRALAQWYRDTLGMQVLFDNGQEPPTFLVGGPAGGMIEIMPERGFPRPQREFYAPGISHIALLVDDFDA